MRTNHCLGTWLLPWALFCATGCVDPEQRMQDFGERCEKNADCAVLQNDAAAGCRPPIPGELGGQYWFILGALDPTLPVIFLADLTTTPGENGATLLQMDLQPIRAPDRKTPVCSVIELPPMPIDRSGRLDFQLPVINVPGQANPFSGNNISATPILRAEMCGVQDSYCGDLAGQLLEPLEYDLTGGAWTLLKATDPSTVPDPIVVNCRGDTALPPPAPGTYPPCE